VPIWNLKFRWARSVEIIDCDFKFGKIAMDNKKPPIKLVTWKNVTLMIIAAILGIGLAIYRSYSEHGHLTKVDIIASLLALVMGTAIMVTIIGWANRPEKRSE
jgi:Ni,Fe-hydrogenase I cytochrome b subunit